MIGLGIVGLIYGDFADVWQSMPIYPRLAAAMEAAMLSAFTGLVWIPAILAAPTSRPTWSEFTISWAVSAGAWVVAASLTNENPATATERPAEGDSSSPREDAARASSALTLLDDVHPAALIRDERRQSVGSEGDATGRPTHEDGAHDGARCPIDHKDVSRGG